MIVMEGVMLSKPYLYGFTKRVYGFIRDNPRHIRIAKIRNKEWVRGKLFPIAGLCSPDTNRIVIDYRTEVIAVLIHELLHAFHPEWCESKVERMERALINQLSQCQMRRLLKLMSLAL